MPCCEAKQYKWCKDLPVVNYKDEEGNEYCIFHAPQDKKGVPVEKFNEEVFKRINEAKRDNSIPIASPSGPVLRNEKELIPCNLSGTVFEGNIDFTRFNSLPPVDFSFAKFNGEVNFSGIPFSREADFRDATFNGEAHFSGTTFKEGLFSRAIFNKVVNFSGTKFVGTANFLIAEFSGMASFFGATFGAKANFKEVEFRWVNFSQTMFNEDTDFMEASVESGSFSRIIIKVKVKFEGINLKGISLIDTDLRKIDFINCDWPKRSNRFKWFKKWHEKYSRNILYDELNIFFYDVYNSDTKASKEKRSFWERLKYKLKREWNGFKEDISCDKEKIKKVEILYRRLKQKYKEEHDEFEVSNWHYGEKEMFRKGNRWRRFLPSVSTLYWLSSGYGEKPVRAGIALFLLIIALSILFGLTGIKAGDNGSVIKIIEWPAAIWNLDYLKATIEYATFESKPTFIPENWFLKIAAKLLIPLQAALFALALRNRFRR